MPRIILGCLSLATAFVPTARADALFTNIAELVSLSDADFARNQTFSITGTLIADISQLFVVQNDLGRIAVHLIDEKPFRRGDVIRINSGKTVLTDTGIRLFKADNITRLGHVNPPEPICVPISSLSSGKFNFAYVRVQGRIREVFADEVDSRFTYLILAEEKGPDSASVLCSVRSGSVSLQEDSKISIAGVYTSWVSSPRRYGGPILESHDKGGVITLERASDDPSVFPKMPHDIPTSPVGIRALGKRQLVGTILAVWNGNQLLLRAPNGNVHRIELAHGQSPPRINDRVLVGGASETDLYNLNLSHAVYRTLDHCQPSDSTPVTLTPEHILNYNGLHQVNPAYHGKLIRLRGIVTLPQSLVYDREHLYLSSSQHIVPVNISATGNDTATIPLGCTVEVTGICLMTVENWRTDSPFPKIKGFSVITRTSSDIRIITRAPWWTPTKFMIVIGILAFGLVGVFAWNRSLKFLVDRRGRELLREQIAHINTTLKIEERTRLAVELHDSLSQNLAGVACQVEAMRCALTSDPGTLANRILTVKRMLLSCRTELRRCLFDLRGDALEMQDMNEAIRTTLAPIIGAEKLSVRFNIPRQRLLDTTAHAILCTIRELVANAIRHGRATEISIAGGLRKNELAFSVRDNGSGFDPDTVPGMQDGHFGLQGIRDRVAQLGGSFSISTRHGETYAKVSIRLPS